MFSQLSDVARSVWAKSLNEEGDWLPLWQHMDDSADVAGRLFIEWLAPSTVRLIAAEFGGNADDARTVAQFLAGVHDIGKATPAFAVQDTLLGQRMSALGLHTPSTKFELVDRDKGHHTITGHHVFKRWLVSRGWSRRTVDAWAIVLGGHHGIPPDSVSLDCTPLGFPHLYGGGLWDDVRRELIERQARRTGAQDRLDSWTEIKLSQQVQVLLTGLVIMSDWIASNEDYFPFHAGELPQVTDETERAEGALKRLDLPIPWRPSDTVANVAELFAARFELPAEAMPRPVQTAAVDIARVMSEPGPLIVEAPMGEGKTEAALAAAEVLAARWGCGGVFVALPTQATSNAMFARVVDWLDAMGADGQQVGGSIMLSHGKKRFNRLFKGFMLAGWLREIGRDQKRNGAQHAVVAHSWLSGRKTAQLANFTIGTIDQILFAGLKSRHLMLRHLGLAGKVVILDEIHAYDAYMNSYLMKVLTWLGAYRVPVIALSATLPADRRRELLEAYQAGRATATGVVNAVPPADISGDVAGDIGYPVLTWSDDGGIRSRVAEPSGRATTFQLEALDVDEPGDDMEALVSVLTETLSDGGTALVVRNTVRRVLATAERLEQEFPGEVTISHSRFITADRERKDTELLDSFGSPRRATQRPERHIVVATQVIEQSLDVDLDFLVTDLAPVDLVLQRMGRVHRHERGKDQGDRPAKLRTARVYIAGTDFTQHPPALEPVATRYVYGAHELLRAAAVLLPRLGGRLELPTDIAPLVQEAYGLERIGPASWQDEMSEAETGWRRKCERRQDKAEAFQISMPGQAGRAIVGWVAADVGEADDESQGQGQVRDGAPSLEALLLEQAADGTIRTPGWLADGQAGLEIPQDQAPSDELAEVMAACALRLPLTFSNADAEGELWTVTPPPWEASSIIYRIPALFVDHDGWGEINGRRVRYTADRGLEVFDVDGD